MYNIKYIIIPSQHCSSLTNQLFTLARHFLLCVELKNENEYQTGWDRIGRDISCPLPLFKKKFDSAFLIRTRSKRLLHLTLFLFILSSPAKRH